jgi:hypothetical protein
MDCNDQPIMSIEREMVPLPHECLVSCAEQQREMIRRYVSGESDPLGLADAMAYFVLRDVQRLRPREPCSLCRAAGLKICDTCDEIGKQEDMEMAKLSDYYGGESRYLRADDIPVGSEIHLTIARVAIEVIEQQGEGKKPEEKAVAYFVGRDKGLVLNAVNGSKLAEAFGDEIEACAGRDLILYRDTTQFRGSVVPCLRIRVPVYTQTTDDVAF